MKTYEVTFTLNGHRYGETVQATNIHDARRLIHMRYPRCFIWTVTARPN